MGCIIFLTVLVWRYTNHTSKKLKNQTTYIDHLYNMIPEGIVLVEPNNPYRLWQLNDEAMHLLGYAKDTSFSQTEEMTLGDVLYPEDCEKTMMVFSDAALADKKYSFETRILKKDKSMFWAAGIVERTKDASGKEVLIVAFYDITLEKLAKEAIENEKSQERLMLVTAISNSLPVIVNINLSRDAIEYICLKSNIRVDLDDISSYSQLYERMAPLVYPDGRDEFFKCFSPIQLNQMLEQSHQDVILETKLLLADEQYHWVSIQIIYVDIPYSSDKRLIGLVRVIDEQRYKQKQQRRALQFALESAQTTNEAKSQFLSKMSHDIRTPLKAIIGMTTIVMNHIDEKDRVADGLQKLVYRVRIY